MWRTDIPRLELAPKFVFGLIGALGALFILFIGKSIFSYLDSKYGLHCQNLIVLNYFYGKIDRKIWTLTSSLLPEVSLEIIFPETIGIPDEEDKEPIHENEASTRAYEPFSISSASAAVIEPSTVEHQTFTPINVNTNDYYDAAVRLHIPEEDTTLDILQKPIYGTTV